MSDTRWHPIETHNGTAEPVLVAEANGGVVEAYFSEEHNVWWEINSCDDGSPGSDRRAYPTHWMPLPAPPGAEGQAEAAVSEAHSTPHSFDAYDICQRCGCTKRAIGDLRCLGVTEKSLSALLAEVGRLRTGHLQQIRTYQAEIDRLSPKDSASHVSSDVPSQRSERCQKCGQSTGFPNHPFGQCTVVAPVSEAGEARTITVVVNGQPVEVNSGPVPSVIQQAITKSGQIGAPVEQWELRTREGDVIPHDLDADYELTGGRMLFLNLGLPKLLSNKLHGPADGARTDAVRSSIQSIGTLIAHVGCGSLDNAGQCETCDAIRKVLAEAGEATPPPVLVELPTHDGTMPSEFEDWASQIIDEAGNKADSQVEWEIVEALQKAWKLGRAAASVAPPTTPAREIPSHPHIRARLKARGYEESIEMIDWLESQLARVPAPAAPPTPATCAEVPWALRLCEVVKQGAEYLDKCRLYGPADACRDSFKTALSLIPFVEQEIERFGAPAAPPTPACTWTLEDEDGSAYQTSCGEMFEFTTGGPEENKAKWCQYCGKPLVVAAPSAGETPEISRAPAQEQQ